MGFESGYKTEWEIDNGSVNRQHNCILDNSGRQKNHKALSIKHRDPQSIQTAVDYELYNEFCDKNPPDADGLLIKNGTIYNAGEHGIKGKAKEEWTGRLDDVFQYVQRSTEDTAGNRSK